MSQSETSGDGTAATRHAAVSPWRRKQAEAVVIWFLPTPAPPLNTNITQTRGNMIIGLGKMLRLD